MTRLKTAMAVLLVSSLPVMVRAADERAAIRVYVTTGSATSGNEAATQSGLEASTTDLRQALAKRKGLTIVPTAEEDEAIARIGLSIITGR